MAPSIAGRDHRVLARRRAMHDGLSPRVDLGRNGLLAHLQDGAMVARHPSTNYSDSIVDVAVIVSIHCSASRGQRPDMAVNYVR